MVKYGMSVRRAYESEWRRDAGREIPLPGLSDAESQVAVPAMALGQLVGVLMVESSGQSRSTERRGDPRVRRDGGRERDRDRTRRASRERRPPAPATAAPRDADAGAPRRPHVRFFAVDGSTFLDGDYLIKGVAGRILWSLLGHYDREGRVEFTNKEVRLDPSLELPEFRDNLESRLSCSSAGSTSGRRRSASRRRAAAGSASSSTTPLRLDEVAAPGA